ncbi:MAG: VCBS repeat-containing protein [Flavobacteriales bacterium]|nr:VCBS repeat-containing protein [Flavobacteriales bacterium]
MSRRLLSFLAPTLLAAPALLAQQPQLNWDEVHYTGQGTNTGKRVIIGPDTAVYAFGEGGSSCYLAKYRSYDGQPQWTAQWDSATVAVDLVRHPNGMLVAGWVFYNEPFNSPLDIGVSAFSAVGDPLWTFTWNDSLNRDDIVRDLHIDANGDIVLCATTEELFGNPSVFNNVSVLKLDAAGTLLWRRTWNGATNNDDEPNAIWTDAQSNVYVAGYSTGSAVNSQDLLVLKYDAAGVFQWQLVINRNTGFGSHVDIATHVQVDPNGNVVVAGLTESPGSNQGEDISVYRFGPNGNILNQHHYNNQVELAVYDLELDAAGRALVLGRINTSGGDGEVVVRVNTNGTLGWAATNLINGIGNPVPAALALAPDGNVIVTGTIGDQLLRDAYVRAYDSNGTALWMHRYTATNSFNEEEGRDVAVGTNGAIYVTGLYDQSGQSLIRGVTYCLCPEEDGVCLLAPTVQPTFPANDITGSDIDQDGWRDLIFTMPGQNTLGVYMGGPGGFTLTFPVALPATSSVLGHGDLDQDGDDDVVAAELGGADLRLVLNSGGTLAFGTTLSTNTQGVNALRVADLDGQNGPDIVVTTNAAPNLFVYLNNGAGSFTASTPTGIPSVTGLATGDVDGNGTIDLLMGRIVQDSIYVLDGDGLGGFGPRHGYYTGMNYSPVVGIGDMDFDGITDLVACNGSNSWCLRPGLGNGIFGPRINGSIGQVTNFIIAPFPQDTSFRMLAGSNAATQRLGYSSCSFAYNATTLATTLGGAHRVNVADWTNDGIADILSYAETGEVRVWEGCDTSWVITGVPQGAAEDQGGALVAYPSPSEGTITVVRPSGAVGAAELSLWTMGGERVRVLTTSELNSVVDLRGFADGVYLVRFRTARSAWTGRVVLLRGK